VQIKDNTLADNNEGIDCAADCAGSTFKANEFRNNRARGIMLRSATRDNVVKDNVFDRNRVGVLLFGAVDTIVKGNILSSSLVANIRVNVLATGNTIRDNTATTSPAGIEFLITPTGSATGNSVLKNTLIANPCGLKGPLSGNIVRKNVFVATATEICP
jgi:parallel beta-helix repeat protein